MLNELDKETAFFIYLLEQYAACKTPAQTVSFSNGMPPACRISSTTCTNGITAKICKMPLTTSTGN